MGHEKVTSACRCFFFPTVIRPFCTFAVKRYSFSASGINLYKTTIDDSSMLRAAEPDRRISKRKFTTADKCNRGNPNDKRDEWSKTRITSRKYTLIYRVLLIRSLTLRSTYTIEIISLILREWASIELNDQIVIYVSLTEQILCNFCERSSGNFHRLAATYIRVLHWHSFIKILHKIQLRI